MAQQITNNNLILDSLTSPQASYADNSVTQFDNLLDIANKTLKQSNLLKNSKTNSTSTENSKTDVSTTNTNKNTNTQSGYSKKTEKTTEVTSNIDSTDTTTIAKETSQDSDETSQDVKDINKSSILDIVSQYTYLETETETDINLDINQETEECVNIDSPELTIDENINVDSIENTYTLADSITDTQTTINMTSVQTNSDLNSISNTTEDSVNINVSEEISLNNETQLTDNKNIGKDLISQKMVDELNITIEDISNNSETEGVSTEPALMDSTEQAIKYMMDKETDNEPISTVDIDVETETADTEKIVLKENSSQKETVVDNTDIFKTSDTTEDLIADADSEKDIKQTDNSIDSTKTEDTQDIEEVAETDTDSSTDEDNNNESNSKSQDNNQENYQEDNSKEDYSEDNKTELKKQIFTSEISEDVETITNQADSDITTNFETASINKGHVHNISATTNSQAMTSASNHTNISKEDVLAQIHNKLQSMNATNNSKITMVLNPESLGKVSIQLINTKDGLSAEMQVASQAVKDILDSNLTNLKETLSAQGVSVNDVSVKISQSENNAEMDYTEQENDGGNKQEQNKRHQEEKDKQEFEKMFSTFQNDEEQEIEG